MNQLSLAQAMGMLHMEVYVSLCGHVLQPLTGFNFCLAHQAYERPLLMVVLLEKWHQLLI